MRFFEAMPARIKLRVDIDQPSHILFWTAELMGRPDHMGFMARIIAVACGNCHRSGAARALGSHKEISQEAGEGLETKPHGTAFSLSFSNFGHFIASDENVQNQQPPKNTTPNLGESFQGQEHSYENDPTFLHPTLRFYNRKKCPASPIRSRNIVFMGCWAN
jgi:hypothetical protein